MVTIWRKDTPQGQEISDSFAESKGFESAEEYAAYLIETANYSANPVALETGEAAPEPSGDELSDAQLELLNVQLKTKNLVDEFIRQSSNFGRYTPPSVDEQFDEADQEYANIKRFKKFISMAD